ncbi:ribonuclease catalytic domain-containing protein [Cyanobium sp. LEGE 06143]|uniref:ribonuclease catalytic domain-containing protein n=1 Tax=Cyanobium sp. LEGE 06143 TaxID=945727 RepID=UPI00351BECF3
MSDERGAHLAVVLQIQGSRLELSVGFHHRQQQLPRRQVELILPLAGAASAPPRLGVAPWDFSEAEVAQSLPRRRDFAAAWLLLSEDQGLWPFHDWAELVASSREPQVMAACWQWLQGPQLWFRSRQQGISARPLDDLRRLRQDRHRLARQQQRQAQWHDALRRRTPIQRQELAPEHQAELDLLLAWASGDQDTPLPVELARALHAARCTTDGGGIRHLLVDLGHWDLHRLPSLQASSWQQGFSAALEAEAERLILLAAEPQPGDDQRLDLSHQYCVTIDDPDTRDIDDGLALERLPQGGLRLWIHVADPGRLVAAGSPLDLEARRRGSSLYLANGTLPMFPTALATGPLSLRAGCRNAAWSMGVELTEAGAVASRRLLRSWVRPAYRLSYADADELIELAPPQDPDLSDLDLLLQRRRQWRLAQGALLMDQPEGRIRVSDGEPQLEITEPGASRQLVAEAMILAGAVVAGYGQEYGLALPYRSQLPAELPPDAELKALPAGPVRHAALKRCLSRGHTGSQPSPHFSLGLEAYVQATSPIRRYGDLLVQRQLWAQQQGEPTLDAEALQEVLQAIEAPIRQGIQISRDDQRHWQQVWFEAHRSEQWEAAFLRWLRPQDGLGLLHLETLAMDLAAECPAGAQPGDSLLVRVQQVDPLRDQLRLIARS